MGLDMYLTASANMLDSEGVEIEGLDAGGMEIAAVEYRAGYWRKANAIHKWFVDNRGDGEDSCQEIPCHLDHLEALVADCKKVIDNNDLAQEVLPTEGGFFFGGTEYDGDYFSDIQYTHDRISEVIKLMRELDCDWATYQASW